MDAVTRLGQAMAAMLQIRDNVKFAREHLSAIGVLDTKMADELTELSKRALLLYSVMSVSEDDLKKK